ncbi:penicillin-binding protein 2 [Streptococcus dysgalactiae subsp. equisimilis 167]|nr:penicillin-binding protein 2 [Streptococcus dysgalactiae subsp. equisimilis 167]
MYFCEDIIFGNSLTISRGDYSSTVKNEGLKPYKRLEIKGFRVNEKFAEISFSAL